MAAVIKLFKVGKGSKKVYHYRIAVADKRKTTRTRFIEQLGSYDPTKDPAEVKIDKERALYWLGVGAQPSSTVKSIFKREGIKKN